MLRTVSWLLASGAAARLHASATMSVRDSGGQAGRDAKLGPPWIFPSLSLSFSSLFLSLSLTSTPSLRSISPVDPPLADEADAHKAKVTTLGGKHVSSWSLYVHTSTHVYILYMRQQVDALPCVVVQAFSSRPWSQPRLISPRPRVRQPQTPPKSLAVASPGEAVVLPFSPGKPDSRLILSAPHLSRVTSAMYACRQAAETSLPSFTRQKKPARQGISLTFFFLGSLGSGVTRRS